MIYVYYKKGEFIMARTSKKNVYERIEEQQNKILETEKILETLNEELQLSHF